MTAFMNSTIESLLVMFGGIGLVVTFRMLINIVATAWYEGRHQLVEDIKDWSCEKFHDIMNQPRPWYVRLDDKLTRRHL